MRITYQLPDNTLVYDVVEDVTGLNVIYVNGDPQALQVLRRREFSISGTVVKTDIPPADLVPLADVLSTRLNPSALSVGDTLLALAVALLPRLPSLAGATKVSIPTLPDDIGAKVAAAHAEHERHECNCAALRESYSQLMAQCHELQQRVTDTEGIVQSAQGDLIRVGEEADLTRQQNEQEKLNHQRIIEGYKSTITSLEKTIAELSEKSTALQLGAQS